VARTNFAEVAFSLLIHHQKLVIPAGGTALFAVPERRNHSSASDFRFMPIACESQSGLSFLRK
jgi:hypothetical protein